MEQKVSILDRLNSMSYLDLSVTQWILLWTLAFGIWFLARFAITKGIQRFQTIARQTSYQWDDLIVSVLQRTHGLVIFILSFHAAGMLVGAPPATREIFYKFVVLSLFLQAAIWGNQVLEHALRRYLMKRNHFDAEDKVDLSAYSAISITGKFLLWLLLFLLLLDNLGINITALVTGLGIGGIAVALAMQNILGDIFASLSIVLDRPFEIGDFIIVGDKAGTVENIGLKTSRIKSLSGEQLVFPNKTLIEKEISNFKRMRTRRIQFTFGVVYNTPADKLRQIPDLVRAIIQSQKTCVIDRVHLARFTESAVEFEIVYIMQDPDYNIYMDTQQAINLQLFEQLPANGVEFAFPTRTVILQSVDAEGQTTKTRYQGPVVREPSPVN